MRLRKYKLYKFLLETNRLASKEYGAISALGWGCNNTEQGSAGCLCRIAEIQLRK